MLTHCSCVSPGLTHWVRVMHKCISKIIIIGSDDGLSPGRHQAIIWTIAGIFSLGPLGTKFSGILIKIHTFSLQKNAFENVFWKMAAILSWPWCAKPSQCVGSTDCVPSHYWLHKNTWQLEPEALQSILFFADRLGDFHQNTKQPPEPQVAVGKTSVSPWMTFRKHFCYRKILYINITIWLLQTLSYTSCLVIWMDYFWMYISY